MENYVIEKKIGSGSYGNCFLVHLKTNTSKKYVIKKVPMASMSSKERKAAQQEVSLLQSLQHPNIVSYRDSFMDGKDLCIVMSYCAGGDLASKVKAARGVPISEEQILKWVIQIALALDYVHSKKILHRDLKCGNIFLSATGQIKLGDFGIARVLNKTMDMAMTSIGTPLYMSPECCNNKPYSFKSDVWSLGCVIYELTNQTLPFNATDLRGLFMKIVRGVYAPVKTTYSSGLRGLIEKMLITSSAKRPTVRNILQQPILTKVILDYSTQISSSNVATTMDIDAIERNSLQAQIEDLNLSKPEERSFDTPRPSSSNSSNNRIISPKVLEKTPPKPSPYAQPLVLKKSPKPAPQKVVLRPQIKGVERNVENRIKMIAHDKERVNEAMAKLQREREERVRLHEERMKKINKEREEKLEALRKRPSPRPVMVKAR